MSNEKNKEACVGEKENVTCDKMLNGIMNDWPENKSSGTKRKKSKSASQSTSAFSGVNFGAWNLN